MNALTPFILVASANQDALRSIRGSLGADYGVDVASSYLECLERFTSKRYEFTFIDVELMTIDGIRPVNTSGYKKILKGFWRVFPTANIVVLCCRKNIRQAVSAVKAGAANYLIYPVDPEEVAHVTQAIYEEKIRDSELDYLRDQFWEADSLDIVQTGSPAMRTVFDKIRSVAPTRTTVLLYGETGTGKGVMAGLIHAHSNRRGNQFIGVHCGAIPDSLIESELFGHEKGAFTGAVRRKLGKFEIASEGTIFLDEIGTVTPAAQIKLLKVLQERTFQRVGGEDSLETGARVIAATNNDLKAMTDEGLFRKDLYYRLNVFPIEIPTLSERKEDIPILVRTFLKRLNQFYSKDIHNVHPLVMEAFMKYSWPGNIRELENLIERSYILESTSVLTPESFPSDLFAPARQITQVTLNPSKTLAEVRRKGVENIERQYLKELLTRNRGRIQQSADDAGISSRQLHKLLTKYGIKKEDFK